MGPDKCETQPEYYLIGQVVAAYIRVRLWPTHQLVGVAKSHSLFVVTPRSGFRGPCIWAFLSSLRKITFSANCQSRKIDIAESGGPGCRPGFKLIGNKLRDPKQFKTAKEESIPLRPSQTYLDPPSSSRKRFTKKNQTR
jgi:hypothetical protein